MMKLNRFFLAMATAGIAMASCSNNKSTSGTDSSGNDGTVMDTTLTDTTTVGQADSTHSFRNDRGTDSVSAGKSIPAKP